MVKKSVVSRYRVDKVPMVIRPQFYLYGYGLGLLLYFSLLVLRVTCKIRIVGREKLTRNSNHIFGLWHSFVPLGLTSTAPLIPAVLDRAPHAWLQHPVWYMKPIHVLLRLMGINRIILGSSGYSGRDAAELLVEYLRLGYSTVINPDGPNGPAFNLKRGILHLSLKSNVPIVPLRILSSSFRELNTWDRKRFPRPFSTIVMEIGDPIYVTSDNFEYVHELIEKEME